MLIGMNNSSVALVAGLATGIPVVILISVYVTYYCCKRKKRQADELLHGEPRLWRRDGRSRSSQDLFIPPFMPGIVQRFVQHSSRTSSGTTSTQNSPVEDKQFFSEGDSGSYRTANDDVNSQPEKSSGGENLSVPSPRRASLLQLSTSSGDSSESIYEHRTGKELKSPRSLPKDSKSFEFVRPIPIKPTITITRIDTLTKDDMSYRIETTKPLVEIEQTIQSHSDSQIHTGRSRGRVTLTRDTEPTALKTPPSGRRGSSDRGLMGRRSSTDRSGASDRPGSMDRALSPRRGSSPRKGSQDQAGATGGREPKAAGATAGSPPKIPVNIPAQVIHPRREPRGRSGPSISPGVGLGRLNVSLQYKRTTCDLFVKIIQSRDLPARDLRRNTTSSYVRVYALPTRRHNHRTNIIERSLNPSFNELFIISGLTLMEVQQLTLQFLIIHNEAVSRNVVIGEVMLSGLGQFDLTGDEVIIWKDIKPYHFQNVLGELHISICHQPMSNRLSVTVLQARNLPKISHLNIGDPYIKVELFSSHTRLAKKKTRVKKKTVSPKFAQVFSFDLHGDNVLDTMTLVFTVMVQDSSGCHERVGQVVLSASSDGSEFDNWSQVIANPHCPIEMWHMIHE